MALHWQSICWVSHTSDFHTENQCSLFISYQKTALILLNHDLNLSLKLNQAVCLNLAKS